MRVVVGLEALTGVPLVDYKSAVGAIDTVRLNGSFQEIEPGS
jgi:hypothetical protein